MEPSLNPETHAEQQPAISLEQSAEMLRGKYEGVDDLAREIRSVIFTHANSLPQGYEPKDIIESRFTPAQEAFEKGMVSCGAVANMSANIFRQLGFKVRLVDGSCEQSPTHAWISVFIPETNAWKEYDLTRKNVDIPESYQKRHEVDSWEEIKEELMKSRK